eukprot:CAMPEP_0113915338 /NCGR_PEP_ID=MMETSP0780_2-20120614/31127_1 /TAXON_ID=652834 /ORGANISM="Palpitomonas bilix" /LENGTH=415 /DNA_ID=CAMNT_0000913797 /DNA_START=35 /DNA_END=1282 /DNA_ORIENTATION=+ /assembly_acc=CAM_ASM_000599
MEATATIEFWVQALSADGTPAGCSTMDMDPLRVFEKDNDEALTENYRAEMSHCEAGNYTFTLSIATLRVFEKDNDEALTENYRAEMSRCEAGNYTFTLSIAVAGDFVLSLHYSENEVNGFPKDMEVVAASVDPALSTYASPPPHSVQANDGMSFDIQLKDGSDNAVEVCDSDVEVKVVSVDDGTEITVSNEDQSCEKGVYTFSFSVPSKGSYRLKVFVDGAAVPALTSTFEVLPSCVLSEGEVECGGHGLCTVDGCHCNRGYFGEYCDGECLASPAMPCHDHGVCDNVTGVCHCESGFKGPSCGTECPGGSDNPCYGNGVCTDEGECECFGGYNGDDCLYEDREVEEAGSTTVLIVLAVITALTLLAVVVVVMRKRWQNTANVRMAYQQGGCAGAFRALFMRQPTARRFVYHDDL